MFHFSSGRFFLFPFWRDPDATNTRGKSLTPEAHLKTTTVAAAAFVFSSSFYGIWKRKESTLERRTTVHSWGLFPRLSGFTCLWRRERFFFLALALKQKGIYGSPEDFQILLFISVGKREKLFSCFSVLPRGKRRKRKTNFGLENVATLDMLSAMVAGETLSKWAVQNAISTSHFIDGIVLNCTSWHAQRDVLHTSFCFLFPHQWTQKCGEVDPSAAAVCCAIEKRRDRLLKWSDRRSKNAAATLSRNLSRNATQITFCPQSLKPFEARCRLWLHYVC